MLNLFLEIRQVYAAEGAHANVGNADVAEERFVTQ